MEGGRLIRVVMGILGIAIGLFLFPIILTGAEAVRTAGNASVYVGLVSINGIVPILALLVLVASGGYLTYTGVRRK